MSDHLTHDTVKRMDIKEFRELGYLQELNRRFLHPLGLALEVVHHDDGTEVLGGIWDYRDDEEGIRFGELTDSEARGKHDRIEHEWNTRERARVRALGYMVQPVDHR